MASETGVQTDDRIVVSGAGGGSKESGVAEREHTAIGSNQPIATPVRGGRHAHDRLAEPHTSRRPQEPGVAKGKHTAIGSNQPIATPVRSGRHAHDRLAEPHTCPSTPRTWRRQRQHTAIGSNQPIATPVRRAAMPTTGSLSRTPPVDPKNLASPKANTPPSEATSQ